MYLKSLTPAVRDLGRIDAALFLPDVLVTVFGLGVILSLALGGPLIWFAGLAALGFILTRSIRRRSVAAAVILALLLTMAWLLGVAGVVAAGVWMGALGALLMVIPVWLAWRAVPPAIRIRRAFGKPGQGRAWKWRVPRDARALKLILPAFQCFVYLILGTAAFLFGFLIGRGLVAGYVLRPFTRGGNTHYRQILQLLSYRAQEIRAIDQRPPVLFFHSFLDDDLALGRQYGLVTRVFQISLTLEELVVDRIWSLGPVIAIGKPREEMSPIGAAREYLDGASWQPRVAALLEQSVAVVSVLGETAGLLWEYRRAAERHKPLLIVVPHADPAVLISRWRAFCEVFPPAASVAVPPDGHGEFPLLAWFPTAGEPAVLFCRRQDEASYRLALDELFQRIEPEMAARRLAAS